MPLGSSRPELAGCAFICHRPELACNVSASPPGPPRCLQDATTDVVLPPPPVVPAPEAEAPESPTDSASPSSTAAATKPEAAGKPPQQDGGRKLLELLPRLGWRRQGGLSKEGMQPGSRDGSPAAQPREPGQAGDRQRGQGSADVEQHAEQGQHDSAAGSQPEELLPTRQTPLQSEGSSAVLLASGAQLHVTSLRQGTQHREHAVGGEAGSEDAAESSV